jgi:hypothetical protein
MGLTSPLPQSLLTEWSRKKFNVGSLELDPLTRWNEMYILAWFSYGFHLRVGNFLKYKIRGITRVILYINFYMSLLIGFSSF